MDGRSDPLKIDPEAVSVQIEAFLRLKLQALGKQGIIIGASGGFDSTVAAFLAVRAVGADSVRLLNLPDRDSKAIHRRHAQLIADKLGVTLEVREITPILSTMGVYQSLPISAIPGKSLRNMAVRLGRSFLGFGAGSSTLEARFRSKPNSFVAKGNAYATSKHRLRMVLLCQQAEIANLMVVGAANRTELMTGTFAQWGCDQCADVMPLIHLYRSQLQPLARYLGVPAVIMEKAADPDVVPGVDDKEALLGSFLDTDRILVGLERGASEDELAQRHGTAAVERITRLVDLSKPMRESPYAVTGNL